MSRPLRVLSPVCTPSAPDRMLVLSRWQTRGGRHDSSVCSMGLHVLFRDPHRDHLAAGCAGAPVRRQLPGGSEVSDAGVCRQQQQQGTAKNFPTINCNQNRLAKMGAVVNRSIKFFRGWAATRNCLPCRFNEEILVYMMSESAEKYKKKNENRKIEKCILRFAESRLIDVLASFFIICSTTKLNGC